MNDQKFKARLVRVNCETLRAPTATEPCADALHCYAAERGKKNSEKALRVYFPLPYLVGVQDETGGNARGR